MSKHKRPEPTKGGYLQIPDDPWEAYKFGRSIGITDGVGWAFIICLAIAGILLACLT